MRYGNSSVINEVEFEFRIRRVIGAVSLDGDKRSPDWSMARNFVRNTNFGIYGAETFMELTQFARVEMKLNFFATVHLLDRCFVVITVASITKIPLILHDGLSFFF